MKIDKNFWAIIIGAMIIGGCVYFGFKNNIQKLELSVVPKVPVAPLAPSTKTEPATNIAACGAAENTIVTKVIDGDTVVVEGGWHVRLLGMDADEKGYPCYEQAKTRLENLVLAKQVTLEKDKTDLDQYDRCLRYIFIGGVDVDAQLVKEGLAIARFYEPDVRYKIEIAQAEKQAQQSGIGCKWQGAAR